MKTKIVNGEYVDFAVLLEKSESCKQQDIEDADDGLAMMFSRGGKVLLKNNKAKKQITSIYSWTSAFFIFSSIYLQAHPTRALELINYAHLIRTIASRFWGWGWRSYDQQFRMRQQSHPQRSWSIIDGELWSL